MNQVVGGRKSSRRGYWMVEVAHIADDTELALVVYSELTSLRSEADGLCMGYCLRMVTGRYWVAVVEHSHYTHFDLHRGYSLDYSNWRSQEQPLGIWAQVRVGLPHFEKSSSRRRSRPGCQRICCLELGLAGTRLAHS